MNRLIAVLVLSGVSVNAQTITETFGSGANQFSIDFVEIGNPENSPGINGFGSVSYTYFLGKHEISRDMILRSVNGGNLSISMADMTSYGGNGINQPATGITWTEAAIFINWLNTSKGFSPAYKIIGTTFSVWSSNDIGFNPNNSFRNTQAKYFLPSTNEWWKGAYGSPDGSWSIWPTGSNTLPESISGGPVGMVYGQAAPAEITNAGSPSKWGTEAQGGNVWEWTETAKDGINDSPSETRELLGGSWWYGSGYASAYGRPDPDVPNIVFTNQTGLRVAMVPEPSSLSLLLAGVAVLMAGRRRKS